MKGAEAEQEKGAGPKRKSYRKRSRDSNYREAIGQETGTFKEKEKRKQRKEKALVTDGKGKAIGKRAGTA